MTGIDAIVESLREELQRIDRAIAILGATGGKRPGHRLAASNGRRKRGRRRLSAAARRRISQAAKARWATAKKAGKNSL
jgi:hypothetical protein